MRDERDDNADTMSVCMHVCKNFFPTWKTRINCPKTDENEAIFINSQFVLRARHVLTALFKKTIRFRLRIDTRLMFFPE